MKKIKQFILFGCMLILIATVLSGCTQENNHQNLSYINQEYGFELIPPEGWTVNENTQDPVKFFCPDQNDYQVNLAIKKPILSNETLNTAVEQLIGYYTESYFKNFSLISSKPMTINDLDAYEIVFSEGREPYLLQHKQVFFEKNKKIYSIVYTSLVTTFDTYISVVDQSINSFTII
jgi:hypothetical protein